MFFEIFKNSMRATCEFSEKKGLSELPVIKCKIFKTQDDITIKISDRGGGISRREKRKVFNYMYSTAPQVMGAHQCSAV
jgi:pyruvate dehydrogenase kinase 2/3/4